MCYRYTKPATVTYSILHGIIKDYIGVNFYVSARPDWRAEALCSQLIVPASVRPVSRLVNMMF